MYYKVQKPPYLGINVWIGEIKSEIRSLEKGGSGQKSSFKEDDIITGILLIILIKQVPCLLEPSILTLTRC